MNIKTFGVADPQWMQTLFWQGVTLAFWKKAISFFMPNHLIVWTSGRNGGNPTWWGSSDGVFHDGVKTTG
jgi:hypothetical protein